MSDYKLTINEAGDTEVIIKAGSNYVRTCKPSGEVAGLIATAKSVEASEVFDGFGIALDGDMMYVAGTFKKAKPSKAEKPADEEKAEPKKTTGKKK